ncbi:response regulator transcription factor [Nocardia sp. CDC153]|uniref:response regulator transcription factor n=1 Tax=Nocardia sp. CDC153 TaxID=3112167 RepID=UPI002DB6FD30|nr:response regulator transcription factor [Nocardia sp. CDC153]MEC3957900.1 response regulator transcription factor [Nocardia sp. CDC153]
MIAVLVVDDDPLVRIGLRAILDAEPDLEVVGEAQDGTEVADRVRALGPDIVLMDVRMPDMDGIAATRELLTALPQPPKVIVITTFENDSYVYDALRVGAAGFLLKRARPAEIVQAVRTVAAGDSLLFPDAIRALVAARAEPANSALAHVKLTEREAEVLRAMARGQTNAEIGASLFLGVETVKTHVGNVLMKLRARDRTQAVILAYESGFIAPGR